MTRRQPLSVWDALVLGGGFLCSLAVVLAFQAQGEGGEGIGLMSVYVWFVLPAGALLVGMASGIGYGLAALLLGRRPSWLLILCISILQIIVYLSVYWIAYAKGLDQGSDAHSSGFGEYFDVLTRSMTIGPAFEDTEGGGLALGGYGYLFRVFEGLGFAFGGLFIPLGLMIRPYCSDCASYMSSRNIAIVRVDLLFRDLSGGSDSEKAAFVQQRKDDYDKGLMTAKSIIDAVRRGAMSEARELIYAAKKDRRFWCKTGSVYFFNVSVSSCPRCRRGVVGCTLIVPGQPAEQLIQEPLSGDVVPLLGELR